MESFLRDINTKHRVRDPIYGFVFLTDAERNVIDTPLFQRLRRIHQLALTKYVYPSAEHSRFVHSLGVMHCATLILSGIFDNKENKLLNIPSQLQIKTLRFAALLHDIGHLPFSHAVEGHFLQGHKHEEVSAYIIEHYRPITSILESEGVKPKEVAALLAKKPPAKYRLLHEVISGHLDADRADYLLRDAHFVGARYGEYDFPRFLQIFAAKEDDESGFLTLFVDESDLHVAESLLIARYHYNLQIPYHRTRMGYDMVLERFVRDFDEYLSVFTVAEDLLVGVDFERFVDLDDSEIMERIKAERRSGNPWAPYLLRAKHLIPVIDTNSNSSRGERVYKALVRRLAETTSLQQGEDYFMKRQEVALIKSGGGKYSERASENGSETSPSSATIMLRSQEGKGRPPEYVDIRERSWIFKQFADEPPALYRVYVTPERAEEVMSICSSIS